MNLYTKLWLKFAPKGWRGLRESVCESVNKYNKKLEDRNRKLEKENTNLRVALNRLQSAYHTLVNSYEMIGGGVA